jgi:hypothetical protein
MAVSQQAIIHHLGTGFSAHKGIRSAVKTVKFISDKMAYEGVSISFWTGHLKQELQMVQLSATRCSCIAIL